MKTIDFAGALGLTNRTVTTNGRRTVVRMSRTLPTSVEDVWNACTDPDRLARWLGVPNGERREGGIVVMQMTDNANDTVALTILRCDAPRRLVVEWRWPEEPDSIVEVNLDSTGDGQTRLTLEHSALTGDLTAAYGAGWEDYLLRLGWLLDGGEPSTMDSAAFVDEITPIWTAFESVAADDHRWPTVAADDAGTVTLHARHRYEADQSAVWAAITDPRRLSAWMAPMSGDLTMGGSWTVAYDNGSAAGSVTACEPERRLVTTWRWDHEPDAPESILRVELAPQPDGGTVVELRHERVTAPGNGYAAGWHAYMVGLDRHLRGGDGVEADWQADWSTALAMIRP